MLTPDMSHWIAREKTGGQVKAVAQTSYGPPDALQCLETAKPSPKDNEVLVQVHASSVNAMDWRIFTFPRLIRRLIGRGLRRPKYPGCGADDLQGSLTARAASDRFMSFSLALA